MGGWSEGVGEWGGGVGEWESKRVREWGSGGVGSGQKWDREIDGVRG